MANLYKPGTALYWAQLTSDSGKPAVARLVAVTYSSPRKKHGTHAVKIPHRKYPTIVNAEDISTDAATAEKRLKAKISAAQAEHAYQIDMLYQALHDYSETTTIDWSHMRALGKNPPFVSRKEFVMPTEPAIVHTFTNLQDTILAAASRKAAQRALVVNAHRATLHDAASMQQIAALNKRNIPAEQATEVPVLIEQPEENPIALALTHEHAPTEDVTPRAIARAATEHVASHPHRSHVKPGPLKPKRTPPK